MIYSDILLHTHLEGSIPYNALVSICARNSKICSHRNYYSLQKDSSGVVWGDFRKIFSSICDVLITKLDFFELVVKYGLKLKCEGVNYAEFHFSPWKHLGRGIRISDIEMGVFDGIEYLRREHNFTSCLIIDFVRKEDEDKWYIMDWVLDSKGENVKAIGVSGGIPSISRSYYKSIAETARDNGLSVVAHAGELESPESIVDAIENLRPNRISHGIKCVYDKKIMELIERRSIHLEICPSANEMMGIMSKDFYEISALLSNKISFSINTDDELIFNTDLKNEFNKLYEQNIIDDDSAMNIIKNTKRNSFLLTDIVL